MKIAMIGHKRIPSREGGIEIVVSELSTRMVEMGHEVVAYNRKSEHIAGEKFHQDDTLKEYDGVKLEWVKTPNNAKLNAIVYSFLATLKAIFKRFDVYHFHAEGPSSMVLLAKLFRKKCVVTIHGLDWQRSKWGGFATKYLLFGEKIVAKYADEVIVLSKNVKEYFLEKYNRETVFIPNGINEPQIREPKIIKEKYGLDKDDYILFLGRIVPEKGVHYLIEAYNKIDTDKKLVIAGGASHTSDYENEVHEIAKGNDNVIFTGFVQGEELDELYSNAYIYCLPSDLEGMPISLLEAMSYGNACLTSDISECTEVFGENGFSFKKGDVEDLKNQIVYLITNQMVVDEYKTKAKGFVLNTYNWHDVTEKTITLYEELTK